MSGPLRILQLYPKADYFTGAAIQLRELAWGLRDRVHAVVVVCESIKRGLIARGIRADKIEVMYPSVDTDVFHPGVDGAAVRRELGFAPEDFVVTQIGVRSWKGNDDVIDAMALVAGK